MPCTKTASISYKRCSDCIADTQYIEYYEIRDKRPIKKQGLTEYYIVKYIDCPACIKDPISVFVDSTWVNVPYVKYFPTLREASNYLKGLLYDRDK